MTTPELKQGDTPTEQPQVTIKEQEIQKEAQPVEEKATSLTPAQLAAQVADTTTQQQPQPAPPQIITITVPATTQQLDDWSKGSPDDSLTWLAFYWIRMIKKAIFYGWRVITGGTPQVQN